MADDAFELSRRKALAGLGTIGVASAGAGLGTSAFFSDTESFENNQLTAGELDLKVDWEEHYYDGSDDETDGLQNAVEMSEPSDSEDYTALPDPQNPLVWVHNDDLSTFMDNTAVEAYPDVDDDGVQDPFNENGVGEICTDGADMSEDLDPANGYRTEKVAGEIPRGEATVDEQGNPLPLVNIDDVKPGDFGEVTFSFHLCDNPGYVWLNGEQVSASEGGVTEPEGDSSAETSGTVELLDEIQTTWWYDEDGDNVLDVDGGAQQGGTADIVIVIDTSGSMGFNSKLANAKDGAKALVDAVGPGVNVGLVPFSSGASVEASLGTSPSDVKTAIDNLSAGGGTDVGAGITAGQNELTGPNGRSGASKNMVVLTNGQSSTGRSEATAAKNAGTRIFGIAYGSGADQDLIEDISSPPKLDDGQITADDQNAFVGTTSNIASIFTNIGGQVGGGEEVFFRGTLRESLNALSSGNGIPLDGDLSTDFDEIDDSDDDENRECFVPSMTNYFGFAWYVPKSVGNQIQSDSVSFDLGFYTEQCRHNDGSGQA